jgi:hypothetical protein
MVVGCLRGADCLFWVVSHIAVGGEVERKAEFIRNMLQLPCHFGMIGFTKPTCWIRL